MYMHVSSSRVVHAHMVSVPIICYDMNVMLISVRTVVQHS